MQLQTDFYCMFLLPMIIAALVSYYITRTESQLDGNSQDARLKCSYIVWSASPFLQPLHSRCCSTNSYYCCNCKPHSWSILVSTMHTHLPVLMRFRSRFPERRCTHSWPYNPQLHKVSCHQNDSTHQFTLTAACTPPIIINATPSLFCKSHTFLGILWF